MVHGKYHNSNHMPLLSTIYFPDIDTLSEINTKTVNYFQDLVDILWWDIDFSLSEIYTKNDLLSSYLVLPHQGQLKHY